MKWKNIQVRFFQKCYCEVNLLYVARIRQCTAVCSSFHGGGETRWPLHTVARVASVTTSVFWRFNCHHTWKHITPGDEMLVLENSM